MIGEIWPELPELYSSMFKESGSLVIRKNDIVTTEKWKVDLWQETLEFYCGMFKMKVQMIVYDSTPDIYTIVWTPNG